jgi:hypothetical protein
MATEKFNCEAASGESGEYLVARAYDVAALGQSIFEDLAGLFSAIKELSPDGSTIHRLASIGSYLADDWANMHNREREALKPATDSYYEARKAITQ